MNYKFILLIPLLIFLWEYAAVRTNSEFAPSTGLSFFANILSTGWRKFGIFFAWSSSFLTVFPNIYYRVINILESLLDSLLSLLKFSDMYKALERILSPINEAFLSWRQFPEAYVFTMDSNGWNVGITLIGSTILFVSFFSVLTYFEVPDRILCYFTVQTMEELKKYRKETYEERQRRYEEENKEWEEYTKKMELEERKRTYERISMGNKPKTTRTSSRSK